MGFIMNEQGLFFLDQESDQQARSFAVAELLSNRRDEFQAYYEKHYDLILKTQKEMLE